jgi:hypothetical protein
MGKPTKETKMVIWDPGRGFTDPELCFEWHGLKFFNKTIHHVTDEIYEAVKHMHNFHEVYSHKYTIISFNKEVLNETEDNMVQ